MNLSQELIKDIFNEKENDIYIFNFIKDLKYYVNE